jgi:hypothetical protein
MKSIKCKFGMITALLCFVEAASAFYDPAVQRWLNRDPLAEPGFEHARRPGTRAVSEAGPREIPYVFVQNSPLNGIDPFGLIAPAPMPGGGYTPPPGAILVPTCGGLYIGACIYYCAANGQLGTCVSYVWEGPGGPLDVHVDVVCVCCKIAWPGRPR